MRVGWRYILDRRQILEKGAGLANVLGKGQELLTVGMEHFTCKFHLRRAERVIWWEDKFSWEHSSFETGSFGAPEIIENCGSVIVTIIRFNQLINYVIRASHSKKLSSLIGPATIPSGGFRVNSGMQK